MSGFEGRESRVEDAQSDIVADWKALDQALHDRVSSNIAKYVPDRVIDQAAAIPASVEVVSTPLDVLPRGSPISVVWFITVCVMLVGFAIVGSFLYEISIVGAVILFGIVSLLLATIEFAMIAWVGVFYLLFLVYVAVDGYPFVALLGVVLGLAAAGRIYFDWKADDLAIPVEDVNPSKKTVVVGFPAAVLAISLVAGLLAILVFMVGIFLEPTLVFVFLTPVAVAYYGGGYLRNRAENGDRWIQTPLSYVQMLRESQLAQETVRIVGRGSLTLVGNAFMVIFAVVSVLLFAAILMEPLLLMGVIGLGLAYFGYAFHLELIAFAGRILGGLVGLFVGGVAISNLLLTEPSVLRRLVVALVTAYVFAMIGGYLMVVVHELAIYISGFLAASVPTFVILAGIRALRRLATISLSDFLGPLAVAIVIGLVGAFIAMAFYQAFVILVTSFTGSLLTGGAIVVLATGTIGASLVGLGVFITGSVFQWQYARSAATH